MPLEENYTFNGAVYLDGEKLMDIDEEIPVVDISAAVEPVGDLHSVPHYRCGLCYRAVVLYENDPKPDECPWCGIQIDWKN